MIANSHRPNAAGIGEAEGPVTVANQVTRRFIPRESLGDLPGDPLGRPAAVFML
jgi:hypothetical protein